MKKRTLSMFLVLCMVFTMMPTFVMAQPEARNYPPNFNGYDLDENGIEWEILRLVNIERAKVGVPALQMTKLTQQVATIRAIELLEKYSHERPDGTNFYTAMDEVLGKAYTNARKGENIAASLGVNAGAKTFMNAWMNSPEHKANILHSEFQFMDVGVKKDENTGELFAVQVFAGDDSKYSTVTPSWGADDTFTATLQSNLNKEHLGIIFTGTYAADHGTAYMPLDNSMLQDQLIKTGVYKNIETQLVYNINNDYMNAGDLVTEGTVNPNTDYYRNITVDAASKMITDANNGINSAPFLLLWNQLGCVKSQNLANSATSLAELYKLPIYVLNTPIPFPNDEKYWDILDLYGFSADKPIYFPHVFYYNGSEFIQSTWGASYTGQSQFVDFLYKNNIIEKTEPFVANAIDFEVGSGRTPVVDMRDCVTYGYEFATTPDFPEKANIIYPSGVFFNGSASGAAQKVGFQLGFYGPTFGKVTPYEFPTESSKGILKFSYNNEDIDIATNFIKVVNNATELNKAFSGFKATATPASKHSLNIRLKADINGPIVIAEGNDRNFNIDLNGFSIKNPTGPAITHNGTGTLTFSNIGEISAENAPAIVSNGTGKIALNGVTVTSAVADNTQGTITIAQPIIESLVTTNSTISNTAENGYAVYFKGINSTAGYFVGNNATIQGKVFPENVTVSLKKDNIATTNFSYGDTITVEVTVLLRFLLKFQQVKKFLLDNKLLELRQ